MSAVTKFSFDTSFDLTDPYDGQMQEQEAPPPEPTYSAEELAAARSEGFGEGHQSGMAESAASLESAAVQALNDIAAQLSSIAPMCQAGLDSCRRDSVAIAHAIVRRTVDQLAQETAIQVIEGVLGEMLTRVIDEPRVVIRVHDDLLDSLQQRMSAVTEKSGFPGSVILLGEPELAVPDCRIEWADGGAEYSHEAIMAEIDALIERHRAGIGADAAPETPVLSDTADTEFGAGQQQEPDVPQTIQTDIEENANG